MDSSLAESECGADLAGDGQDDQIGAFALIAALAGLTEGSLVKGLLSGAIGLVITIIGSDPIMSVPRFTLGSDFLRNVTTVDWRIS